MPGSNPEELLRASQDILAGLITLTSDSPADDRAAHLYKRLYCPVCPGETIDKAEVPLAKQMRGIVNEKLGAGEPEPTILAFFVELYGWTVLAPVKLESVRLAGIDFDGSLEIQGNLELQLRSSELLGVHSHVKQAEEYIEPLLERIGRQDTPVAFWFSNVKSDLSDDTGLPVLALRYDIPDKLEDSRTLFSRIEDVFLSLGVSIVSDEDLPHGGIWAELNNITLDNIHFEKGALFFEPTFIASEGQIDGSSMVLIFGGVPANFREIVG